MADIRRSREFYAGLGFRRVDGNDEDGWAVMVNGESRLGLYTKEHMGNDAMCLNFRGGDVASNVANLKERGYAFSKELSGSNQGGFSATLMDPDGFSIFLDTSPGETKKV